MMTPTCEKLLVRRPFPVVSSKRRESKICIPRSAWSEGRFGSADASYGGRGGTGCAKRHYGVWNISPDRTYN